jgi:hypothetical protein
VWIDDTPELAEAMAPDEVELDRNQNNSFKVTLTHENLSYDVSTAEQALTIRRANESVILDIVPLYKAIGLLDSLLKACRLAESVKHHRVMEEHYS